MSHFKRQYATAVRQDGSGKSWSNIPVAKIVDRKASACTPTKHQKPKDVYYDIGVDIGSKNKVVNCSFCISLPIIDTKSISRPVIEFYDGSVYGRNAPYKTKPIKTVKAPTKRGKVYGYEDTEKNTTFEKAKGWYHNWYNCKGLTGKQLKNLIVKVKWGKANYASKITIGWARMEVLYEKEDYNLSIYSKDATTVNTTTANGIFKHTIVITNKGSTGRYAYYKVNNPKNTKFVSGSNHGTKVTSGVYKGYWKKWIPANSKVTLYHNYLIKTVGKHTFKDILYAELNSRNDTQSYNWSVTASKKPAVDPMSNEQIILSSDDLYINTDGQYINLVISGVYNADGYLVYRWNANDGCTGINSNHMLNMSSTEYIMNDSLNVSSNDIQIDLTNQTIRIDPNPNGEFMVDLEIPVNPTDDTDYSDSEIDGYYYEGIFYEHFLYDEMNFGYYHNGVMYQDENYQTPYTLVSGGWYRDLLTGTTYLYGDDGLEVVEVNDDRIYYDIIEPQNNAIYIDVISYKKFKYYDDIPLKVCRVGKASATITLDIFGNQSNLIMIDTPNVVFDHDYPLTIHTGLEGVSTINCKSNRFCFFEPVKTDYKVLVESPIAYIGTVAVEKAHQADNTASTKNGLISNNHLNRTYKGKTGNIDEDIGMRIFLSPAQVATLQGLAKLDKPIPLNLVPHMLDGDPLNHRGWAELYEVNNIKKINSMVYECEPVVDYLTHDLNTSFQIIKEGAVNKFKVPYYLSMTHDFIDKLTDVLSPSAYKNIYIDGVDDSGYVGEYELPQNNELIFTSNKPVGLYGDWDFKWRNILPVLTSEDYDNNLNIAIQLVTFDSMGVPTVQLEHVYDGFKHYDLTNNQPLNRFSKVITRYLENGVYKEYVHGDYSLLMNNLTPLSYNNKIVTKIWANSDTSISKDDEYFDLILATDGDLLISGAIVNITIESDYGYYDSKKYMTDMYGRIRIKTNLENGDYKVTASFEETEVYRPVDYKIDIDVNKRLDVVILNYLDDYKSVNPNDTIIVQMTNEDGVILPNKSIVADIRDNNSEHYGACVNYITDNEGKVYIPVYGVGGSKIMRVRYLGDETYNSAFLEQTIYINNPSKINTSIESDDIVYNINQENKTFNIKLLYGDTGLGNEEVKFMIYNNKEFIERTVMTDNTGVASIPLNLSNGNWYIDTYYGGKTVTVNENTVTYSPALKTNMVSALTNDKKDTMMTNENNNYNSYSDEPYRVVLTDIDGLALADKVVNFEVYNDITGYTLFNGNIITDADGVAKLPFYDNKTNLKVTATFNGDTSYDSCEIVDYVSYYYGNSSSLHDAQFIADENIYLHYIDNDTEVAFENAEVNINITVKDSNNVFNTYNYSDVTGVDGIVNLPLLSDNDYYINISWSGNNRIKPCNIMIEKTVTGNTVSRSVIVEDNYDYVDGKIIDFNDNKFSHKLFEYTGVVKDEITGKPINGAFVTMTSDCISKGYTNENGEFTLYVLNNKSASYFTASIEVKVGMLYNTSTSSVTFSANPYNGLVPTSVSMSYYEGSDNLNYQEINVNVTDNDSTDEMNIGDTYILKIVNLDSNQMMTISGLCMDKVSSTLSKYNLDNGRWFTGIYVKSLDGYYDCSNNFIAEVTGGDGTNPIEELITINGDTVSGSIINGDEDDYSMFGSLVSLELRDDKAHLYDFGYTNYDKTTDVKIMVEDIPLPKNEYYVRFVVRYGSGANISLNDLNGLLQCKVVEDISTSDKIKTYSNMIVSPTILPNNKCLFTRLTDEGRLYYYSYDNVKDTKYIGSPFNFYKGGTNLKNQLGSDIFDLSTGANPIYLTNGLCKISIHRISGYVELFAYDPADNEWYYVNTLKIDNHDYTTTLDDYDDDRIIITFSGVTFTMWRGRPYVEIKHNGKDIRLLDYRDRVYCETTDNEFEMRLIEESEVDKAIFDVNTSVQKFDKELQVGQNISLDNFDLYTM